MNKTEQAAFIKSYMRNMSHLPEEKAAAFVARWFTEDVDDYDTEYYNLVDAMGIWSDAQQFNNQGESK